ncbi:MAG TPA: capsule assembly Wzi family protein [Candidatus Kryptonia bacterium]
MRNLGRGILRHIVVLSILLPVVSMAQTELVPVDHKVYPFLETMSMKGLIDYNSASIPISRGEVASYLKDIAKAKEKLSPTERKILADVMVEFRYDIDKSMDESYSFLHEFKLDSVLQIFSNDKQKYLASYADSNFSLFLDGIGAVSYRNFDAKSFQKAQLSLFEIGPRLRGTLYDNLAFYVQVTEGQSFSGSKYARQVATGYDPSLAASTKFVDDKFITAFNAGYMRYETANHAVSLTIGRDNFEMGNGYIDKLFISDNIPPFDFGKLDIDYKFFRYSFFYGNLQGDSLGAPLTSKSILGHRLDIELSRSFRFGLFESLILSNVPFSFTYLNPASVIESENLGTHEDPLSNALIGFDCEFRPHTNIGIQLSFLIDDLNTSTLGKKTPAGNDNKFGYQAGFMYVEPFGLNDLSASVEYTRIDPFVYSHRTNMSNYTNWGISIGAALPPNSDEVAFKLGYYLTNRITLNFLYKHQRSGEGFLDVNGNPTFSDRGIITRNFGGDVNRGDLDFKYTNVFLMGFRVNRDIFDISTRIEPVRQYFLDISYSLQSIDQLYLSKASIDQFLYVTASTDF